MQKRVTNSYFNFTRKERNGTVFLLIIILLITAIPFLYSFLQKEKVINAGNFKNELAALKTKQQDDPKKYYPPNFNGDNNPGYYQPSKKYFYNNKEKAELFYFDPNTISADEWKRLGLNEKTISTIQHFILKGGKFRQAADIKKIWGLHEDEVERLLPFVRIEGIASSPGLAKTDLTPGKYEPKKYFEKIDINLADTSALIKLPGIGTKLSGRIINFRDKLGGFYSIEQVAETFGLPDSVFQKIRSSLVLDEKSLKKININTGSLAELKQHPYIRYNLANLIVQYRAQHGNFSDISDLKKIMIVDETLYNKLSPYLAVQ